MADPRERRRDCLPALHDEVETMEFHAMVQRARGEYLDMPGLNLTVPQAARLWGLDTAACNRVLGVLICASFLRRTRDGRVVRADRSDV